jgi:hypothetical protein
VLPIMFFPRCAISYGNFARKCCQSCFSHIICCKLCLFPRMCCQLYIFSRMCW